MKITKKLLVSALCACTALAFTAGIAIGFGNTVNAEFAYTAGTEYDSVADYVIAQTETGYKGITVTPFTNQGVWWDDNVFQGETKIGTTTYNAANLSAGSVVVLEFVNSISAKDFEKIKLAFAYNGEADFEAYNVNEITGDVLGTAKTSFRAKWMPTEFITLDLANYADENGTVTAIAFKQTTSVSGNELAFSGFILTAPFKYAEGTEYDASEEYVVKQTATEYNGLAVEPFDDFGTFWDDNFFKTTGIGSYTANAGTTNEKVAILEFVHPINANEFSLLKLRACSNGGGNVAFFNAYEISEGKLGEKKFEWNIGNISLQDYSLYLADFADENGVVDKIAIQVYDATDADGKALVVTETVIDGFSLGNVYTVEYKDENGKTISSERVVKGEKATCPQTPEVEAKEGYEITFIGWYNGETKWDFDNDTVTENIALTAKFDKKAIEYTFTFTDSDGNETEVTYTVDTAQSELEKLKEKLHASDEKYIYTNNLPDTLPLENGKSYYEKKETVTYTVIMGNDEVKVGYGDKVTRPNNPSVPTEEGYEITFIGWYNGETEWDFDNDTVTENITLTAKFDRKIIEYTVTFVADGKTVATEKYTVENKRVTEPDVPEKEGYAGEWESYELNCSDITVKAVYTEITPEPDIPEKPEENGGCNSATSCAGIAGVLCLACAAVIAKKKKRDN